MNGNTKGAPEGTPNTTEYKGTEFSVKKEWSMKFITIQTIRFDEYDELNVKDKADLLDNIVRYARTEEEPNGASLAVRILFGIMRGDMNYYNDAYQRRCSTNKKNIEKRWNVPSDTMEYDGNKEKREKIKEKDKDKERLTNVSPKKDGLSLNAPPNEFSKFNAKLKEQCPHVAKMETQMSETELKKLVNKYGVDSVWRILHKMDNWKDLTKKNRNVYCTALNWFEREPQKGGQQ